MAIARWTIGVGGFKGDILLCEPTESILFYLQPQDGKRLVEVECLYVHPLRRRYGWGRKLMQAMLAHTDAKGWDTAMRVEPHGPLKTKAGTPVPSLDFTPLRDFYMSFGYSIVDAPKGKRVWDIPHGGVLVRRV